jgi:DNA-binding NtrC family response regulator
MSIPVPPLRERTEDVPMLARHFLRRYTAEYGKAIDDIRPKAMELLIDYDWPGNVRELENVIQRAVIHSDETSIGPSDLPGDIQPLQASSAENPECADFENRLRQFKFELVTRTLEECGGNKTLAAQRLGLSRAYLHRLLHLGPCRPQPLSLVASASRAAGERS